MPRSEVEINGQRLALEESGDPARPTLVFLHYIMGTRQSWHRVVAKFSPRYHCLAVDFRGHGESSRPERGYQWERDFAADIEALAASLPAKKLVLVGHSLGAMVSLVVANRMSERIAGIFAEEPPLFDQAEHWPFFAEKLRLRRMPMSERIAFFRADGQSPRDAEKSAQWFEQFHPAVLEELIANTATFDAGIYLPKIRCPLVIALGNVAKGGVVKAEHRERLKKLNVSTLEFDDCGHGIHQRALGKYCEKLQEFLNGI